MTELTGDEREALKHAAYGAVVLVSNADPGLLDMIKESFAASKALAGSSRLVKEALTSRGIPVLPRSAAELEAAVLPGLRRCMAILREHAPDEAAGYRSTVLAACAQAAGASGGVAPAESALLKKIEAALDSAAPLAE